MKLFGKSFNCSCIESFSSNKENKQRPFKKINPVYAAGVAEINQEILTQWLAGQDSAVPPVVLDCVVTVPVGHGGPGETKQQGPADATETEKHL